MPHVKVETLAETPACLVRLFPARGPTDVLVCSFAWSNRRPEGAQYLGRIARREGFALIETIGSRAHHFDGITADDFARLAAPHVAGAERVVTLGASLGGYLALHLADRLAAEGLACGALAFSPRIAVQPGTGERPEAQAKARAAAARAVLESLPPAPAAPTIVFDPANSVDARLVWGRLIGRHPGLTAIGVPGAGHRTFEALAAAGLAAPLVRAVLGGQPPGTALASALAPQPRRPGGRAPELHRAPMLVISGVERAGEAAEA